MEHARLEADEAEEAHPRAARAPQLVYLVFYQLKLVLHLVQHERLPGLLVLRSLPLLQLLPQGTRVLVDDGAGGRMASHVFSA